MASHFHKNFPFNHDSSWLKACYAGQPFDSSNLYQKVDNHWNSIERYKKYFENVSYENFIKAMGQQATEYWLLNKVKEYNYIGCTTYRRYLLLDEGNFSKASVSATQESANQFGTEKQKEYLLKVFEDVDVVTNNDTVLQCSIESQYLQSQPIEYWNLFKNAIVKLFPKYENKINWFNDSRTINFETCYIMKTAWFKMYAEEFFEILEYIFQNASQSYPTQRTTSEPFPWRYPGFLGERFFSFFVYANSLKKIQVPLVVLQ